MAPVSIRSSSGVQPGRYSLIEPNIALTEDYGVLVDRTLVDTSQWSASVLLVNPSSEVVVLPSFSCMGDPRVRSRLRSCGRCLILVDLFPLMV